MAASRALPGGFVPPIYKYKFRLPQVSVYSKVYVKGSKRQYRTPVVLQHWRTKKLTNLTAFFRNRFYEQDKWYKARIEKPTIYPTCYLIDPNNHVMSLAERLKEFEDPNRQMIDIGLPFEPKEENHEKPAQRQKLTKTPEQKKELEQLARFKKLRLNVKSLVTTDKDIKTKKTFCEHFNIFKDIFHEDAYFYPVIDLKISYPDAQDKDSVNPVHYGNSLAPSETLVSPSVTYEAEPNTFWTLLMTNPDGNVFEEKKEVLHWMVANIPGNNLNQGELLCDYLQPLPLHKTGWHRIVFVLFKQEKRLDFNEIRLEQPCNDMSRRTFSTPDFYLKHENVLTPAGVSFFQSSWDESCTKAFHERLNMQQPLYEFEFSEPHVEPQQEVPSEYQPFHIYLDKYRDYKDIDKEILLKRLKRISPFRKDEPKAKFPNLFYKKEKETLPSWVHVEKVKENEGYGKYKGIYENPID